MTIAVTPDTLSTNEFKSCCQVRERSPDPLIKAQGLAYVCCSGPIWIAQQTFLPVLAC
jgi:hypothetical protein